MSTETSRKNINKEISPVCLFVYNRLEETKQTVEALLKNNLASESELFIFSDGPKSELASLKVNEVRHYVRQISGFKSVTIFESEVNKGLAMSIIDGVSKIVVQYGKVIVLEDDLKTTPDFLDFMNQALAFYEAYPRVQTINGFSLALKEKSSDVYFQRRPFPWGWATWKEYWNVDLFNKKELFDIINRDKSLLKSFKRECGADISKMLLESLGNKNDSWYVRWSFNHFLSDNYSVYPTYSLVQNIGYNETGTHCSGVNPYLSVQKEDIKSIYSFIPFVNPSQNRTREFIFYFSKRHKIQIRIKLLISKNGRKTVLSEFLKKIAGK
ncbi:glycosyltransferase family 2 protein [Parabacteroides sp. FAFU027]|uniref:glycosyltransferase family 2 protein n=1 Tax=Parabacteroides sp. FAFU027 TaxID=2922715 RepID=UPI001FAE91E5|nr:glycosyltransferase family 2 protein [Parabacteroides sp. FAFU027]